MLLGYPEMQVIGLNMTGELNEDRWDPDTGRRERTRLSPFSKEAFSAVLFPMFGYDFGHGLELELGALLQLGRPYTKFGDPAAGGSQIWTRGRYSF